MSNIRNGLPWKAEAEKETHKGWRIVATNAHYSNCIVASYMSEIEAKAACDAVNAVFDNSDNSCLEEMVEFIDFLLATVCKDYPKRVKILKAMKFKLKHHTCWKEPENPWGELTPSGSVK